MKINLHTLLAIILVTLFASRALGAERLIEGIAAIVNDEVISLYDVDQRVELFLVTSGAERNPESIDRVRGQVLRSLIDEKLQLQEARRVEVSIAPARIDENFKRLADDNSMSVDDITKFMDANNISVKTLKQQIEAGLTWRQYINRRFSASIKVNDQEIEEQYLRTIESLDEPRFLVSEILLARNSNNDDDELTLISEVIIDQLKQGVSFGEVARQFSVSPSAAQGGEIGWVAASQLDPQISERLRLMQSGNISTPIPTLAGIYIILLRDRAEGGGNDPTRDQFELLQVQFPATALPEDVQNFIDEFKTCKAAEAKAREINTRPVRTDLVELRDLLLPLQPLVRSLEAGEIAPIRQTEMGAQVLIVCERKDHNGIQISREAIAETIYSQRISMLARRHLRDLHRDAIVEYR